MGRWRGNLRSMKKDLDPFRLILIVLAGWVNQPLPSLSFWPFLLTGVAIGDWGQARLLALLYARRTAMVFRGVVWFVAHHLPGMGEVAVAPLVL